MQDAKAIPHSENTGGTKIRSLGLGDQLPAIYSSFRHSFAVSIRMCSTAERAVFAIQQMGCREDFIRIRIKPLVYCNTNQLRCLLSALKYKDGTIVNSSLDTSGACLQCTVPAIQTGKCQETVPCGADRASELA
jgi:hypothetical protein